MIQEVNKPDTFTYVLTAPEAIKVRFVVVDYDCTHSFIAVHGNSVFKLQNVHKSSDRRTRP